MKRNFSNERVSLKNALRVRALNRRMSALLDDLPVRGKSLSQGVPLRRGETVIRLRRMRGTLLTAAEDEDEVGSGSQKKPETICTLREMEKIMILKALRIANGNRAEAAKLLGIARSSLFEKLKRHGIPGRHD